MRSLFDETRIKSLTLKNRFVRSATWMGLAAPEGVCTLPLYRCYETLAEGEIGLIITGFAFVSREGQGPQGQIGIYADSLVDGLRSLVKRVHGKGGKIAMQIVHCGNASKPENNGGLDVLGPSERLDKEGNQIARAMTGEEIARILNDFEAAAARAKDAGFDAIQLHYAHGYLGSQFLSPRHNRREDEYGGTFENRFRFLKRCYQKVRGAVGDDYPVMAKLNIEDYLDDGITRADGLQAAAILGKLGLDALEVSGGTEESGKLGPARRIKGEEEEAYFLDNAVAAKAAAKVPVMLVGGLRSTHVMARVLRETDIDYLSMSRPFIREPHLVRRWKEGSELLHAACVSCSGCFLSIKKGEGIFCLKTRKNDTR